MLDFAQIIEVNRELLNENFELADEGTWDSLAIVSTMALVDQYFSVRITGSELSQCKTFNHVLHLISRSDNSKQTETI